jgi:hypothetical protein
MNKADFESMEGHKYLGVADCHGIESFLPYEKNKDIMSALTLRAMYNRHRHAVFYMAVLTDKQVDLVENAIKAKDFKKALNRLKNCTVFLYDLPGKDNSWEMIPNPKLDPWRNG